MYRFKSLRKVALRAFVPLVLAFGLIFGLALPAGASTAPVVAQATSVSVVKAAAPDVAVAANLDAASVTSFAIVKTAKAATWCGGGGAYGVWYRTTFVWVLSGWSYWRKLQFFWDCM